MFSTHKSKQFNEFNNDLSNAITNLNRSKHLTELPTKTKYDFGKYKKTAKGNDKEQLIEYETRFDQLSEVVINNDKMIENLNVLNELRNEKQNENDDVKFMLNTLLMKAIEKRKDIENNDIELIKNNCRKKLQSIDEHTTIIIDDDEYHLNYLLNKNQSKLSVDEIIEIIQDDANHDIVDYYEMKHSYDTDKYVDILDLENNTTDFLYYKKTKEINKKEKVVSVLHKIQNNDTLQYMFKLMKKLMMFHILFLITSFIVGIMAIILLTLIYGGSIVVDLIQEKISNIGYVIGALILAGFIFVLIVLTFLEICCCRHIFKKSVVNFPNTKYYLIDNNFIILFYYCWFNHFKSLLILFLINNII